MGRGWPPMSFPPRWVGEIGINGAAAHLVKPGDLVIIASYGWMKDKAARSHDPRIVLVDSENRPTTLVTEEHNPPQDPFGHIAAKHDDLPRAHEVDAKPRKKKRKEEAEGSAASPLLRRAGRSRRCLSRRDVQAARPHQCIHRREGQGARAHHRACRAARRPTGRRPTRPLCRSTRGPSHARAGR